MKRRDFITLLGGAAAWPLAARAQQAGNLPTIGFLGADPSIERNRVAAFVQRLRELGWIDGRNLAIEYRWAEGRPERVSEIAAEFVRIRAGEPWRCQRPGEVTEPVDRRQTVLRCLFENGGGDAEHESGTPTPQMPIFRAHVRCALRPGRMCDALARSACELVHTAGGGISAIRRHARACAPILSVGSGAHSHDHTGDRTGGRDLGVVPRRMS